MESQPQNPEFRNNPENFHPWCKALCYCPPTFSCNDGYSKTCVIRPLSKITKMIFKTNYLLMQVKSIAECSNGSILQYFWPSLSCHLSLRSNFVYFWVAASDRFYCTITSFLASNNICHLLITFANSLDPGQDWQIVSPFSGSKPFDTRDSV